LRRYFIAFVKIVTFSKFHSFEGLVAYKTIGGFYYAKASLPFIMEGIDLKNLVGLKT
jgi:hypothetical protein